MAKSIKKAQDGKRIDPKTYLESSRKYLESSRKRVKAIEDSAKREQSKKGIYTYEDYLKSKIKEKPVKKQRSGGKIAKKK